MDVGVTTAGFSVEGGFNAFGQPCNNWADWELRGRVEPSGIALRLWDRPQLVLDRAGTLGCTRIGLSFEWARIRPGFDIADAAPPPVDETALDGYADLVAACRERGMEPLPALHHFTHPRWAGVDLWASPANLSAFDDHVRVTVTGVNKRLTSVGAAPLLQWVTFAEPNALACFTGLPGAHPPGGRRRPLLFLRRLDHLMAAHCRAYDLIHDLHATHGWPAPAVATTTQAFGLYAIDRMLTDMLLARENGVARDDLDAWLAVNRAEDEAPLPVTRCGTLVARVMAAAARRFVVADRLPFAVDAVYRSARPRKLDWIGVSWYHPDPAGLRQALDAARRRATGQPVFVTGNGLCSRSPLGSSPEARGDAWTRPRYLAEHLAAIAAARADGVPVAGYYHRTLADGYEWGSYSPRWGIHGVERAEGQVTILDHDASGADAAAAFRQATASLLV